MVENQSAVEDSKGLILFKLDLEVFWIVVTKILFESSRSNWDYNNKQKISNEKF